MTKKDVKTSVRLTDRDIELFQKLNAAGWLTTGQILSNFFSGKTGNAVSKRLRKLASENYVAMSRMSSTEEGLYRLAGKGKLALIEHSELSEQDVTIPTQIPRKFKHFAAINDLRFRFEQIGRSGRADLLFYFSERELALYYQSFSPASSDILFLLDRHGIKPDALCKLRIVQGDQDREMHLAIEYDAGTEQSSFFGRTKAKHYGKLVRDSQGRIGELKVLTFTDSVKRLVSLMRQTVRYRPPRRLFYFAPLDGLEQEQWEESEIFLDPDDFFVAVRTSSEIEVCERELPGKPHKYSLLSLPASSPRSVSPGEDSEE